MPVYLQVGQFCLLILSSSRSFHQAHMHEMALMVLYTPSPQIVTRIQIFFMVSSTSYLYKNTEHTRSKTLDTRWSLLPPFKYDSTDLCRRNDIRMYCLPPHTNHVLQPLDVVIFNPLKTYFNRITQNLKLATLTRKDPINCCKTSFSKLFKQPWESMTGALIKKGFQKCGIFPLEQSATNTSRLSGNSSNHLHDHQIRLIQIHLHLLTKIHI